MGQCATATSTLDITINNQITPTFNALGTIYQNSTPPVLPTRSINGINGIWSPASINTAIVGKTTYIFTPTESQCATTVKLDVTIYIKAVLSAQDSLTVVGACTQVKLNASKSIGDNLKYEWSVIDQGGTLTQLTGINTEFQLSPSYTGPLPADFRVRLLVTDIKGNMNSDTITINVARPPVAELVSTGKLEKDGTMIVSAVIITGKAVNYKWFASDGKIVGPDNQPTANLFGSGIYTLQITDIYGCTTIKNFKFPIEVYQILANPDYAKISWVHDTTINVLANDHSSVGFITSTMHVTEQPARGVTIVNADGSITYTPRDRGPGRDQFVYEVCDAVNLCTSATVTIDVFDLTMIPEGFSPNGDGINDKLVFGGLENYLQSQLYVYTRSGELVYQSSDYQNDWNGKPSEKTMSSLQTVPTGVYYYILKLGGTNRSVKGFIYIGY